jgi:hypothetical protein
MHHVVVHAKRLLLAFEDTPGVSSWVIHLQTTTFTYDHTSSRTRNSCLAASPTGTAAAAESEILQLIGVFYIGATWLIYMLTMTEFGTEPMNCALPPRRRSQGLFCEWFLFCFVVVIRSDYHFLQRRQRRRCARIHF